MWSSAARGPGGLLLPAAVHCSPAAGEWGLAPSLAGKMLCPAGAGGQLRDGGRTSPKKCLLADPCFGLPRFLWFSYCLFLFPAQSSVLCSSRCSSWLQPPLQKSFISYHKGGVAAGVALWPWYHVCCTLAICILW